MSDQPGLFSSSKLLLKYLILKRQNNFAGKGERTPEQGNTEEFRYEVESFLLNGTASPDPEAFTTRRLLAPSLPCLESDGEATCDS